MCTLLTQNICLMCHTQYLELGENRIGDAGLTALAKAVESGALPNLQTLNLGDFMGGNNIGDEGMKALADALSKGALDHLTVCWHLAALFPCLKTWHVHSPD